MSAKRIVRRTLSSRQRGKTDWARVDAMSDRAIEIAAKADPDAAPILDKSWFKQAAEWHCLSGRSRSRCGWIGKWWNGSRLTAGVINRG